MKYLVFIGDGMADEGFSTPLMEAHTPNMDALAKEGRTGLAYVTPPSLKPGSDVANMSILGYNPLDFYTGRGPLEAASIGIPMKDRDIAYRCNLVYIKDNKMADFTADHISNEKAREIISLLNKKNTDKNFKFYPGVSYRNLLILNDTDGFLGETKTTPPHDIIGKDISSYLPQGPNGDLICNIMNDSSKISSELLPDCQVWLWGQGEMPSLPSFEEKFKIKGTVITAVDLIKGLGKIIGLRTPYIEGATGYYDTDYNAKAKMALDRLQEDDFILVHVEAPDEAGHENNRLEKIRAIENFDKKIIGCIVEYLKKHKIDFRTLIMPDHPTPLQKMTHTSSPVPFILYGKGITADGSKLYNEHDINKECVIEEGWTLLDILIKAAQ